MVILSNLAHNKKPCQDGDFKENCNACPAREIPEDVYYSFRSSGASKCSLKEK